MKKPIIASCVIVLFSSAHVALAQSHSDKAGASLWTADQVMDRLQMPRAFTLHYAVRTMDLRSPELRKSQAEFDRITGNPARAARDLQPLPSRSYEIILAGNHDKLMWRTMDAEKPRYSRDIAVIYDGNNSLECLIEGNHAITSLFANKEALWRNGFQPPVPGASIDGLPLIQNMMLDSNAGGLCHLMGDRMFEGHPKGVLETAIVNGSPRSRNLMIYSGNGNHIGDRWDYNAWVDIAGVQVASDATNIQYGVMFRGDPKDYPNTLLHYHLMSWSDTADPSQFDFVSWLHDGDAFVDVRTGSGIGFNYLVGAGSLDQQIVHARWDVERQKAEIEKGRIKGTIMSGVFLLVSLGLFAGAFVWRRRMKARA